MSAIGPVELGAAELRVLGALIEKHRTTPDAYPLSLNALRLACNQSTNRDPVVDYDEATVREALAALSRRRLARLTSHAGSRAPKYRHLAGETLNLADEELAVLAVLMLRGPQTVGELRTRSERLHAFADLDEVVATLDRLAERGLATRLERRPGQKEERYAQLVGGDELRANRAEAVVDAGPSQGRDTDAPPGSVAHGAPDVEERVAALEAEVRALRSGLDELRRELGA